jgi:hypothetical protein
LIHKNPANYFQNVFKPGKIFSKKSKSYRNFKKFSGTPKKIKNSHKKFPAQSKNYSPHRSSSAILEKRQHKNPRNGGYFPTPLRRWGDPPGVSQGGQVWCFQIWLLLANGGHFRRFKREGIFSGIGNCAEFVENGCKFNFISSICAPIRKNNVGEPNVRN